MSLRPSASRSPVRLRHGAPRDRYGAPIARTEPRFGERDSVRKPKAPAAAFANVSPPAYSPASARHVRSTPNRSAKRSL